MISIVLLYMYSRGVNLNNYKTLQSDWPNAAGCVDWPARRLAHVCCQQSIFYMKGMTQLPVMFVKVAKVGILGVSLQNSISQCLLPGKGGDVALPASVPGFLCYIYILCYVLLCESWECYQWPPTFLLSKRPVTRFAYFNSLVKFKKVTFLKIIARILQKMSILA